MQQTITKYEPNILRRAIAAHVDYAFIYGVIVIYFGLSGYENPEGEFLLRRYDAYGLIIIWQLLTTGLEQALGATLGNWVTGLRVLSDNGNKPTILQSVVRRLFDIPDMLFVGLVALITILNTHKKQRLGDVMAKTIVIRKKLLVLNSVTKSS